jgi:hypothetical protein
MSSDATGPYIWKVVLNNGTDEVVCYVVTEDRRIETAFDKVRMRCGYSYGEHVVVTDVGYIGIISV